MRANGAAWACAFAVLLAASVLTTAGEQPGQQPLYVEETTPASQTGHTPVETVLAAEDEVEYGSLFPEQPAEADDGPVWLTTGANPFLAESAFRAGWWSAGTDGDSLKVGEFQDLASSPFWDADVIFSDGRETLDLFATGLDREATQLRGDYFGHGVRAGVEFDQFLRRWDHDPLTGGLPTDTNQVVTEDVNAGEDYAIRVQELKANFRGKLGSNLKWKINLWGLHKFGERQATATAHCFNQNFGGAGGSDNRCHVLSQRQRIDWLTMEIEPALEAQLGALNVEYSRTMRQFGQSDRLVERDYNHFGPFGGSGGATFQTTFPYAIVPENTTQIDRLQINLPLTSCRQVYAYLYHGDTENEFRETHRRFQGFDVRLTDRSIENLDLSAYAKMNLARNELPPFLLPEEEDESDIRHPINYSQTIAGMTGRWRPFGCDACSWRGLSINARYEYLLLDRDFAEFESEAAGPFVQPTTISHRFEIGPSLRLSPTLSSYARYKARFNDDPLFGFTPSNGELNTNQPQQEHIVQVGGTWTPVPCFLASAQLGIEKRRHDAETVDFSEDNYPLVATLWYAPTRKLSLSGGYGHYSNWINQDITIGFRDPASAVPVETLGWNYGGRSQVLSLGGRYAYTQFVQFSGGFEWVRGSNVFSVPGSATGADWSLLPGLSNVIVETTRYRAGVDLLLRDGVSCYLRYNYFDYEDKSEPFGSGTAHFFLAGATAAF